MQDRTRAGLGFVTAILPRALLALALTGAAAPVVLALLRRAAILDHPSERSSHGQPVPRGGGVAPALGAASALLVSPAVGHDVRRALLLTVAAFALLGLFEDVIGVRALHRLGLQLVLAAAAALLLDDLSGPAAWRIAFAAFVVLWLVAFVNAFNFMDGINGISVAQAVGAGATWLVVGLRADVPALATAGAIAAAAALGFAPFNLPTARMFLGDVGSYFFGAWLAVLAVVGLQAGVAPEAVLAPLALYVADTGTTLARRVLRGERWYLPHREHAYQRLIDGGFSHAAVAALVTGCVAACGALGAVSLDGSPVARVAADAGIVAVLAAYLLSSRWLVRTGSVVAAV